MKVKLYMKDYQIWIDRAKSAYKFAIVPIDEDMFLADACFQAQQAAEKAIKALLIFYGIEPVYTHNIKKLFEELRNFTTIDEFIEDAIDLSVYAVTTRYSGGKDDISDFEYKQALEIAKKCIDWVENKISEEKQTGKYN